MLSRFELFEAICSELRTQEERIITEGVLSPEEREDLMNEVKVPEEHDAFARALEQLALHFAQKGSKLPFIYNLTTGRFKAVDKSFIKFVTDARSIRGSAQPSAKQFEVHACRRLADRVTGTLYRVGWPRSKKKGRAAFVGLLKKIGFEGNVLEANDKDGGLDIIWLPPMGAIPLRPIVSLQCKNSSFDREEAFSSVGRAVGTIGRHSHLVAAGTYICFVIFNDYIDDTFHGKAKGWGFIPLGLTDLARLNSRDATVYLM
jgi:hypothetical protein